jgi:hypothetical protein
MQTQTPQLIQYTRKKNGQLNGCLVAAKIDGEVRIGFSKCCKTDVFNKQFAKELAVKRMNKVDRDYIAALPPSMLDDLKRFESRIQRCYKN